MGKSRDLKSIHEQSTCLYFRGGGGAHPKKTKKNQSLHQNRQIGIGFFWFFFGFFGFLKFPDWHWFFLVFLVFFGFFFGFFLALVLARIRNWKLVFLGFFSFFWFFLA